MPSMNGYEFVKQVKKINPKVNVIFMTAFEIEDKGVSQYLAINQDRWFSPKAIFHNTVK
jgi:two-component SAPR family response regulator